MEEKCMSNELVYIAKLCEWFLRLRTSDIENLIDTVPAYDRRGVAFHARVSLDTQVMKERGDKAEELPYPDNWKEHRICPQEAKSLAERIIIFPADVARIFDSIDDALGKEIPIYPDEFTPSDRWKDKIEELKHDDELFDEVYDTFLRLLYVNKISAIRHIISNQYELNLEIPSDIKEFIKKIEYEARAGASLQAAADPISPAAPIRDMAQGGSRPETDKIEATEAVCRAVVIRFEAGELLDRNGKTGPVDFERLVHKAMGDIGEETNFQPTAARTFYATDPSVAKFKRKRGEKK